MFKRIVTWTIRHVSIERFAIACGGVTLYRSELQHGAVVHRICGIRVHTSRSRVSILLHRVLDNKSFDVTEFDSEISSIVDDMALAPACGKNKISGGDCVGYLVSQVYATGGHSRLVRDAVRLLNGRFDQKVFFTRLWCVKKEAPAVLDDIGSFASIFGMGRAYLMFNTEWAFRHVVKSMVDEILKYNPRVLFAYIHPNDMRGAAIIAAVRKLSGIKVVFNIHASHYPNLGVTLSDLAICPLPSAISICKFVRMQPRVFQSLSLLTGKPQTRHEGVSASEINVVRAELGVPDGFQCTMSGANSYKFFNGSDSPYLKMIRELLERNKRIVHVLIASLSESQKLVLNQIFDGTPVRARLRIVSPTPQYERLFAAADVFIDSFPVSSAMTMIDLMRLGVPYVVKSEPDNILISFHEYQRPDFKYVFSTPEGMVGGVERLLQDSNERRKMIEDNRHFYAKTYDETPCREALLKIVENADDFSRIIMEPPPISNFRFSANLAW